MTSESVQVVVIPGHPPQLNIKPNKFQKNVDIQKGITLKGRALNLTTGCLVWWSAVSSPGFQPLDIMNELKLGDNIQIEPDDEGKEEIEKSVIFFFSKIRCMHEFSTHFMRLCVMK